MAEQKTVKILLTGGGTGGHVTPALAVVEKLRKHVLTAGEGQRVEFFYLGSKMGVEKKMAEAAELRFASIETGKWRRYFSLANIIDIFRVPIGVIQAFLHIRNFQPDAVLSMGGFVAVPVVAAAWLSRVPVLIHEQTAAFGLANRLCAPLARVIAVTFPGSIEHLAPKWRKKAVVTGNPARSAILQGDRLRAVSKFGFAAADNSLPAIYITGGVQGSQMINQAVVEILLAVLERCRIIHQCGRQSFERLQQKAAALPPALQCRYHLTEFVGAEIGDVYALADLVISRAGAGTVNELSALGKPSILIPLEPTGGGEQRRNAEQLVNAGAAVEIGQAELTPERLKNAIFKLLDQPPVLREMGVKAKTLAKPQAADNIARLLLGLVR